MMHEFKLCVMTLVKGAHVDVGKGKGKREECDVEFGKKALKSPSIATQSAVEEMETKELMSE